MSKLFRRADTGTVRKTLALFREEALRDRRQLIAYSILIPLNRLLYVVLLPLVFSFIVQSLITRPHDWQHAAVLLGIGVVISAAALITAKVGFHKLFLHEEKMRSALIERAISSLLRHSDQFFANRKVGALSGDVTAFGTSIVVFFDIIFLSASTLIINFSASLIIIAFMSPLLLIPLGLATGFLVWRSLAAMAARGELRAERKTLVSQLGGNIADVLGNQQIVRYFASGQREVGGLVEQRRKIESLMRQEIAIVERETQVRQGTLFLFQLLTMAVCIWLATTGSVTIAALVFAVTYLGRLTSSLFDITPIIRNMEQAFLDAATMTEILNEKPEVIDAPDAGSLVVKKGEIKLERATFRYKDSPGENAIDAITVPISAGQRVGLAGHSGGGKTTLTKLLLRFADLTDGKILIDGQDITKVTQDSLHEAIAYVPQEPYLFHRSLRDNIAYGKPGASDEDVLRAVKQANAYEFIKTLPDGLDTIVGERGVKLSGGQRQRIAIARAILKDAPILILDEATSALDSESEKLIQDALEKLMKGRTSIVVAHRLSTIASLDRILVLDHGRIAEDGPHQKLLKKKNGIYAGLWKHQSGGFLEE